MQITSHKLAAALVFTIAGAAHADDSMSFAVAENHTQIRFEQPVEVEFSGDRLVARPFSSTGYIYPSGVLSSDNSGVGETGEPSLPQSVIGHWRSEGWYIGGRAQATNGMLVTSRQVFEFNDGSVLVTIGEESWNSPEPSIRTIEAATGRFSEVPGVMTQKLMDFTFQSGLAMEFEILCEAGGV